MSNNKQIEKPLELPHQETIVGTNTIQTKPFDNQKIEIMSNNKQSSVEQLEFDLKLWFDIMKIYFPTEIQNSINRSKAMHKEEIVKAWKKGDGEFDNVAKQMSLEYYNETFRGNNDQKQNS